ncbi:MAG: hypothetical protein LC135_11585 [Phycisphaerae bacterium]|jgi:hypothetical protein|nr:hypothetical protein [Phycisphaerae bacterium]MCZ2400489.1 hypothetical protein [Phycisphaerae bacterium]
MRWISYVLGSIVVLSATALTIMTLSNVEAARLRAQVSALEREKAELREYARRLSAARRVAQVEVLSQRRDERSRTVTTLLWQEIGPNNALGKPLALEVVGEQIYFEALVIKFEPQLVGEGDAARGESLAMFRRAFGDQQSPDTGPEIDRNTRPPSDAPRAVQALHDRLWALFWQMVDDPKLAQQYGVRVAQCEAPSARMREKSLWEVSLDAAGGLNIRRLPERS